MSISARCGNRQMGKMMMKIKYQSNPIDSELTDAEILAAVADPKRLTICGRVGGVVSLYIDAPSAIWQSKYTDFGITPIEGLTADKDVWQLKTYGYTTKLNSPLNTHLAQLVEVE